MWLDRLKRLFITKRNMSEKTDRIEVHGTKEGKLYIKPEDLFKQKSVRNLIEKIVSSQVLKSAQKSQ